MMTANDILCAGAADVPCWNVLGRTDSDVRLVIHGIMESTNLVLDLPERRLDRRIALPQLLTLTPIVDADQSASLRGDPVHVVGKWLAERGLCFYHTQNLPFRRAVVSFESFSGHQAHLILDISWSRFLRPGWYDSGGRFTHVVEPTTETEATEI